MANLSSFDLRSLDVPVIIAPMAGGPTTPELAAAGSDAGGLGFLAAGYLTAEVFAERITAARDLTTGPLGANLFVPQPSAARPDAISTNARALAGESERYGVRLGEARYDDDQWAAKLDVVLDLKPEVVSFTFGLPTADECAQLRGAGITTVARCFSGRYARGLRNRFVDDHDAQAPFGYPEIHYLTSPVRAASVRAGDPHAANVWAGTGFRRARAGSVAEIIASLV